MVNIAFVLCSSTAKMASNEGFKHIIVKEIHPTFAAEVRGIDFSSPLTDDAFGEILAAITKVRLLRIFKRILLCN